MFFAEPSGIDDLSSVQVSRVPDAPGPFCPVDEVAKGLPFGLRCFDGRADFVALKNRSDSVVSEIKGFDDRFSIAKVNRLFVAGIVDSIVRDFDLKKGLDCFWEIHRVVQTGLSNVVNSVLGLWVHVNWLGLR